MFIFYVFVFWMNRNNVLSMYMFELVENVNELLIIEWE